MSSPVESDTVLRGFQTTVKVETILHKNKNIIENVKESHSHRTLMSNVNMDQKRGMKSTRNLAELKVIS